MDDDMTENDTGKDNAVRRSAEKAPADGQLDINTTRQRQGAAEGTQPPPNGAPPVDGTLSGERSQATGAAKRKKGASIAHTQPTDAVERAHAAFVSYPRLTLLQRDIEECRQISLMAQEPHCMSLEGPTGAGKSTLLERYKDSFPEVSMPDGTIHKPIVYVLTDGPITVKSMASRLLAGIGDPAYNKGTQNSLDDRIVYYLRKIGCQLVILDDFHNLTVLRTTFKFAQVSTWLKAIIKRSGVPFLVVGVTDEVEAILKANKELSRLFSVRETLYPFSFDAKDKSTVMEFEKFVAHIEDVLGLPLDPSGNRVAMLYRLHYATLGVVANLMNLLRSSQTRALERGGKFITMGDLSGAFKKHIQKHVERTQNPFDVSGLGKGIAVPTDYTQLKLGPKKPRRGKDSAQDAGDALQS